MAPRTTRTTAPADEEHDGEVVDIQSAVDFDLDAEESRKAYPPFRVRLGGQTWTMQQPDAELVMELEEAGTTRAFFQLAFDEQWPDMQPLIGKMGPPVLLTLVRQIGVHFDLDQKAMLEQSAPNRAERRRRRRS